MRAHVHVDVDVADGPETVLAAVESHLQALRAQMPGCPTPRRGRW